MKRPAASEWLAKGDEPVRAQRLVTQINGQGQGKVPAGDGSASAPLYQTVIDLVRAQDRASVSLVQRLLRIGHNRAAGLLVAMEAVGVVTSTQGIYVVANVAGVLE